MVRAPERPRRSRRPGTALLLRERVVQPLRELRVCGCRADHDEVLTGRQLTVGVTGSFEEEVAQLSSKTIADHSRADGAADRERETRPVALVIVVDDGECPGSCSAPVLSEFGEALPATYTADQADSFCLPRRRRRFTMARPARVDMRFRKPCRLARRRTLG